MHLCDLPVTAFCFYVQLFKWYSTIMPFCQSARVLMFHTRYPPEAGVWAYQVNAPILESESPVCVRRLE